MILPVQATFRNIDASAAVAARVQEEANKLDKFFDRITSCRVRQVQMGDKVKIGSLPTAQGIKHADHPTGQL